MVYYETMHLGTDYTPTEVWWEFINAEGIEEEDLGILSEKKMEGWAAKVQLWKRQICSIVVWSLMRNN